MPAPEPLTALLFRSYSPRHWRSRRFFMSSRARTAAASSLVALLLGHPKLQLLDAVIQPYISVFSGKLLGGLFCAGSAALRLMTAFPNSWRQGYFRTGSILPIAELVLSARLKEPLGILMHPAARMKPGHNLTGLRLLHGSGQGAGEPRWRSSGAASP